MSYENFEIHSSIEECLDVTKAAGESSNNGQSGVKSETNNDRNPTFSDFEVGILNTKPNGIESDTFSTRNASDTYIFDNG